MDRARVERTVKRMAYQIAEKVRDKPMVLVGLNEGGERLARTIGAVLSGACDNKQVVLALQTDDLEQRSGSWSDFPDLSGSALLLIDDVIFSGQTLFTALRQLPVDEADEVHVAVLVDRGHRKRPVWAQFVGIEIPTKANEHVEVVSGENALEKIILYKG